MRIVVVGSGTAGSNFALFARKLDRSAEIIVIGKEKTMQYSRCALPFVLSGEISKLEDITIFPEEFYGAQKIEIMLGAEAKEIDRRRKIVRTMRGEVPYDKLILATGSEPFVPPIEGIGNKGVFTLKAADDVAKIKQYMKEREPARAVVIGAGLIGLEAAVALKGLGLDVVVVELLEHLLPSALDSEMAKIAQENLEKRGINFKFRARVKKILGDPVEEIETSEEKLKAELILVATGTKANAGLARKAGLKVNNGIEVDEYLKTSDPDIYAIGDCAEVFDAVTGKNVLSQLGTTALRMAKTAASNVLGGNIKFRPVFNTTITKLFDMEIGNFGITEKEAERDGIEVVTGRFEGSTRPEYYPGGKPITVKLIFRREDRELIGGQIVGGEMVWGRIIALSFAAQKGATVDDMSLGETAYAPPVSPTVDPITVAAEIAMKRFR